MRGRTPLPDGIRITKLERTAGVWAAHVCLNGDVLKVTREHGSWTTESDTPQDLIPELAALLQSKVRPTENRERIEREEREAREKAAQKKTRNKQAS